MKDVDTDEVRFFFKNLTEVEIEILIDTLKIFSELVYRGYCNINEQKMVA